MMITFGFPTCRSQCGLDWFVDGLEWQARWLGFDLMSAELVVVDALLWVDPQVRRDQISDIVRGRIPLVHVPPKPSPFQGPDRLTKDEYAAHSSARNTVLCHARGDYILSVDDLSILEVTWLQFMLEAALHAKVVAGTYSKDNDVVVESGRCIERTITKFFVDGRGNEGPRFTNGGGWFFTGNFGLPMRLALKVNGFDERLNAFGCEDCDMGVRLARLGHETWIEPRAKTIQAQDLKLKQNDVSFSYRRIAPLEVDRWQCNSDPPDRTWTAGNDFVLRDLRASILAGGSYPPPAWFPDDIWARKVCL
jgi:hypothetical protein